MKKLKASIIDFNYKKDQQILDDIAMTPAQRIDKMFILMELCAQFRPSKTLLDVANSDDLPYIVLKRNGSTFQK